MKLRATTSPIYPDESGAISIARNGGLDEKWRRLQSEVIATYRRTFEERLVSVYVRGSAAIGSVVDDLSDFDSFAIICDDVSNHDIRELSDCEIQLLKSFTFVTGIEFFPIGLADLLLAPQFCAIRFQVKSLSKCIFGLDSAELLGPYYLHSIPQGAALSLKENIEIVDEYFQSHISDAEIQSFCRWLMKQSLRAIFECHLQEVGFYTRDIYLCMKVAIKFHARLAPQLRRAVELVLQPCIDKIEIIMIAKSISMELEASNLIPAPNANQRMLR